MLRINCQQDAFPYKKLHPDSDHIHYFFLQVNRCLGGKVANHIQRLRLFQYFYDVQREPHENDIILSRIISGRQGRHQPRAQRY